MKKITLLLLITVLLNNCKQIENMNNKYEWLVETGADGGYPMEILSGNFIYENGEEEGIPGHMMPGLESWWLSSDSGTIISGDQFRPIPVKMELEWYSYAEDKFYTGSFPLDQKKLLEYFKKGYSNCVSGNGGNYNAFLIGLAPGGQVYLYLSGSNATFVHQFKGQEAQVTNFKSPGGRAFTVYTYFGYVNGVEPAKQDYETRRKREQEMVRLFKEFSEKIGGKEFELHFKFDENLKSAKAYLKHDKLEQEIPFATFEFYD